MAKRNKLLTRIRNSPKQVPFRELRRLLESFGFKLDHATGSHYIFLGMIAGRKIRVTIPFKRGVVREVYVKDVLALIEDLELEQEEDHESHKDD